jgi:maleate cis-trans isomerase
MQASKSGSARVGLLTPNAELPGEYLDVASEAHGQLLLWMVVTRAPDSHQITDLVEMGAEATLVEGARRVLRWGAHAVAWACTSGSFVLGGRGALRQLEWLSEAAGCPATSTSLAFVAALRSLGIVNVSVLSPYPAEATAAFERFLREWGISVSNSVSLNHPGAGSSRNITADQVRDVAVDLGRTEPLLVPDTAVWGFELLRALSGLVKQPVLVANQVTLWHVLQLAHVSTDLPSLGVLRARICPPLSQHWTGPRP